MSERLLAQIVEWASRREDVRGAVLVGSHARGDHPADEFSDIDVILFVRDPVDLLDDAAWTRELGDVGITFVEETPVPGVRERRVLFRDGTDVDFVVAPVERMAELAETGSDVLARGFRVLVDKDGLTAMLDGVRPRTSGRGPTSHDLAEAVSDFWYHAVWTARKLARGEVFVARDCVGGYMTGIVIRMAAWHAGDRDTWHGGRFLEEWADTRVLDGLRTACTTYDSQDVERALGATMDLVSWLGRDTARLHGLSYAEAEERLSRELVERVLASGG